MESKALRRLEEGVDRLLGQLRRSADRQAQLSLALGKNQEELERLRREVQRYKSERSEMRRTVDVLIKRFDKLDIDWDRIS